MFKTMFLEKYIDNSITATVTKNSPNGLEWETKTYTPTPTTIKRILDLARSKNKEFTVLFGQIGGIHTVTIMRLE